MEFNEENNYFSLTLYFTDPARLNEVNLGFAISASSLDSDRAFKLMQDVVKSTMNKYPPASIYYSVLSFGDPTVVHINFEDKMSDEDRERAIDSIVKPSGKASLDKALDKARSLFEEAATKRPTAKNILVVIVDKKSDSKLDDVKASARLLEDVGIKVVVVAVGNEVDQPEILVVSPTSILTNTTDKPDSVAEKIIKIIDKGEELVLPGESFHNVAHKSHGTGHVFRSFAIITHWFNKSIEHKFL